MLKRLLQDKSLWILLALNIWCIIYYLQNPSEFGSIVWLYWAQSVFIGIFNFLDILTLPTHPVNPGAYESGSKGCSAFFFLFHYEAFHVAYSIFIVSGYRVNPRFILIALTGFIFNLGLQFVQHKIVQRSLPVNVGKMFFMPYLRILPMHLMILAPVFLHIQASVLFLVLKTLADVIMYVLTTPIYKQTFQKIKK